MNDPGEMKKKKKKRLSKGRRFFKICFRTIVILILLLAIGVVLLSFLYPEEKLGSLVSDKLTVAMGRSVRIEGVSIRPWGKIDVWGVRMGFTEEEGRGDGPFFLLDHLTVQYRMLSLFSRRLDITGVSIDGPLLHVVSLLPDSSKARSVGTEEKVLFTALPVSFGLFHLALKDFSFTLTIPDSSGESEMSISDVHLEVSDIRVPRNYIDAPENLRGKIRFFIRNGEFRLTQEEMTLRMAATMDLTAVWKREGKWDIDGLLTLKPFDSNEESEIGLSLGLSGMGYGKDIRIRKCDVSLGERRVVTVDGVIDQLGPDARFSLNVGSEGLQLETVAETMRAILPSHLMEPLERIMYSGNLHMLEGEIQGQPERVQFALRSSLNNGRAEFPSGGFVVEDVMINIESKGTWTPKGLEEGELSCHMNMGGVDYALNDTSRLSIEGISVHLKSKLDSLFIPVQGILEGHVEDLLGGSLGMDVQWNPGEGSESLVDRLIVHGHVHGDSLDIASFQNSASGVEGNFNVALDVETEGLTDIDVSILVYSDSLNYKVEDTIESTPALRLTSNMALHTDSLFQEWVLDSCVVKLNNLISGQMKGSFSVPDGKFQLALHQAFIENKEIPNFFTDKLKEELEGLELWGKEEISLDIAGSQDQDSTTILVDGHIRFIGVGMAHPVQLLRIEEIEGDIEIGGPPEQLGGRADILVGKVRVETMRSEPYQGSQLSFDWRMFSPDSLAIEKGKIHVKPMAIKGDFFFGLGQLTQLPKMYVGAELKFESKDSVEVLPDMFAMGSLSCRLKGSTLDPEKQWVQLVGELAVDSLDVIMTDVFHVKKMKGRMPFQLEADQAEMRFLPHGTYSPRPWVEYESQRLAFKNLISEMGGLSVETIEVMGYRMDDLTMDVDMRNGYVQIPWFNVNILDGNFGGSILVNLREGTKRDIAYEIRAQASRINSATLANIRIKDKDEEETELNASLAFQGTGIDLAQGIDLEGFFHITKIGPKFASTLLQGMDPQGSDRSIRLTRRFLNSGWKPVLFSFELRHGYVYPSLVLSQPWFSPIRIPERLEYGRLPLEFFLKTSENSK